MVAIFELYDLWVNDDIFSLAPENHVEKQMTNVS